MSTRQKSQPPKHTTHIVNNQSSRHGSPILAVAVHSTESQDLPFTIKDLTSLDGWFDQASSQASAHIGVDGSGNSRLWVHANMKAWTILDLNSVTCNIEFIARAAQAKKDWEEEQIKCGAQWTAFWLLRYGLPAQRGVVRNIHGQAVITRKGIITHKQLTDAGFGSHVDPGPTFPMDDFIRYTQYYKKAGWVL